MAFVSEFRGGRRVFRYVDADAAAAAGTLKVGASDPLDESYCHYVARGELPELLFDPSQHPVSARLAVTAALGVGTHVSVPIRLSDGRVYGTFCCFGLKIASLDGRDIEAVRMLARLTADYLGVLDADERDVLRRREAITAILDDPAGIKMVFQPLVELESGRLIGLEALARFPAGPPDQVFSEAWDVGLGVELELKAVRSALAALDGLPSPVRLGVNVSPTTLTTGDFLDLVESVPPGRLTVEVTEHAAVSDYDALRAARDRLSSRRIRLAIDDVGMGFSGLNHILECAPGTLKIDAAVVRGVDQNPAKTAMIEALVTFGRRLDILVVAEGIETAAELVALRAAGVPVGQGYYLGRPADLAAITTEWNMPRYGRRVGSGAGTAGRSAAS
jgi:EAL domain-containing protein (putative c-di-GMP-specific phosphodiesterase class I)